VNLSSWLELRVPMIKDDIHELGLATVWWAWIQNGRMYFSV
jgi:hypothetical protein